MIINHIRPTIYNYKLKYNIILRIANNIIYKNILYSYYYNDFFYL